MKKLLTMLLCLAMTFVCTGILAACDSSGGGLFHQHSADTWEYDETEHWQVCADCGETFNRGAHIDDGSALCSTCTYPVHPTEGLEFVSVGDVEISYTLASAGFFVNDIGEATDLTNLVIPAFHNGLPVVGIDSDVFDNNAALKSIFLPDTIEVILNRSFRDCTTLEQITLPDSIKIIGENAFENTAYYNNYSNWEQCEPQGRVLYFGNHLIKAIGVTGDYAVREGTVTIATNAFDGCYGLTGIRIPDSVKSIGYGAFTNCESLKDIIIPDSVISIYPEAFTNTAYSEDKNNYEDGALYIGNHLIDVDNDFAGAFTVRDGTVTIASGGEYVDAPDAFTDCRFLTSVTIPDSVKSIGYGAFTNCESLKDIIIPGSVTEIGAGAFHNCRALENIDIPDSISSPLAGTFYGCKSLKTATIGRNVPYIGGNSFRSCSSLSDLTIKGDIVFIGNSAFEGCISLKNVTIPNSVREIGKYAFADCFSLTNITIPDSVTKISSLSFKSCDSLTSAIFENPNGWSYEIGGAISAERLSNPATAAEFLMPVFLPPDFYLSFDLIRN